MRRRPMQIETPLLAIDIDAAVSASANRLAEDVFVIAIVVAELELGDVQRQILRADLVECSDDAALEDRPEAFNRVGVDRANDVLAQRVVDDAVRVSGVQPAIPNPLIGAKQANFLGYRATYKRREGRTI